MLGNNKGEKGCRGGNCERSDIFCACSGHYMWLRWVIGILIIAGVFWLGIQIGSVRQSFDYGYDYAPYQMMRGGYPSMMQRWQYEQPTGYYNMMQPRTNSLYQNPGQQGEGQKRDEVPQTQPQER